VIPIRTTRAAAATHAGLTHARGGLIRGNFLELFSEGPGEKNRRQQSKKIGVTHLRQAQMQHAEQHHDSQPGQRHAPVKREAEGAEHYQLERAKMGEILRTPLGNRGQR
jgi:hypothetical protein